MDEFKKNDDENRRILDEIIAFQAKQSCKEIYNLYKSLYDAGFSEQQAFELIKITIISAFSGHKG